MAAKRRPVHRLPLGRIASTELTTTSLLHFVELEEFIADWKTLELDEETDLHELMMAIMQAPLRAPLIGGTGGLRKLRFAKRHSDRGKSGGVRVCYAYFPADAIVLLVMAYDKHEQDNLTAAEKREVRYYLRRCEQWLRERRSNK